MLGVPRPDGLHWGQRRNLMTARQSEPHAAPDSTREPHPTTRPGPLTPAVRVPAASTSHPGSRKARGTADPSKYFEEIEPRLVRLFQPISLKYFEGSKAALEQPSPSRVGW